MSVIRSKIMGVGRYLPAKVLSNFDLEKMVETSNEWIIERTGISTRHLAAEDECTSDLSIQAAREALTDAGVDISEIDLIIVATTTPDNTVPATAVKVQHALGMNHGFAFDIQAACSGFMYALATADNYIRAGMVRKVLVIGAETLSRIVDWTDRNTCVLFGDGAGAVVLAASQGTGSIQDAGVLNIALRSDGAGFPMLCTPTGVSVGRQVGYIHMEGREVFRSAVNYLTDIADEVLCQAGISAADLNYFVPHQANVRIIEATAKKLGLSMDKVALTLSEHGNTSAASIPLALYETVKSGKARAGDLILLDSMGAGFTWAAALVRL